MAKATRSRAKSVTTPGRLQVGRFPNRAAALDHLVAEYSTKAHAARYTLQETDGVARVVFAFHREFKKGQWGEVQYVGNGTDLSEAIRNLFESLGDSVEA